MPFDLQTVKVVAFLIFGLFLVLGIILGWFRRALRWLLSTVFNLSDKPNGEAVSIPTYGNINMFPAIWPSAILLSLLCAELILSGNPTTPFHQALDVGTTMFLYGGLVFPLASYYSFKWVVLPVLNYLPRVTNNDSYLFNCGIILAVTEITIFLLLFWNNPQGMPYLIATSAIPTSIVGLNCAGHFWFSKFHQPSPEKKRVVIISVILLSTLVAGILGSWLTKIEMASQPHHTNIEAPKSIALGTLSPPINPLNIETPVKYLSQEGLTWAQISNSRKTWSDANEYCSNTTINGQNGWRLPTKDELNALYASRTLNGQGWMLIGTWSSTPFGSGSHYNVDLNVGDVYWINDTNKDYVTCVR